MRKQGDIDSTYHAIRARLKALTATGGSASTTVPPHGHAASAISFQETQSDGSGHMASSNVQEAIEELDSEKLARSGEQPMLGNLDMNHNSVNNVVNIEVEGDVNMTGPTGDITMAGGAGFAKIENPRAIDFAAGATGEARVTRARGIDFEPTAVGEAQITAVRNIEFGSDVGEGIIDNPRVIHMTGSGLVGGNDEAKVDNLERVVFNSDVANSSIEQPSRVEMNAGVAAGTDYTSAEGVVSWDNVERELIAYFASAAVFEKVAMGWVVKMAVNESE